MLFKYESPTEMSKKRNKRFVFGGMVSLFLILIVMVGFLLNPSLSYGSSTSFDHCVVLHEEALSPGLTSIIANSTAIIEQSELYDQESISYLCLQDGSRYPAVVKSILGDDVIKSFSSINVVLARAEIPQNKLDWRGHQFRFDQFLAHVRVHNLQFQYHGLWKANPLGGHPEWKWEGYADYISLGKRFELKEVITHYLEQGQEAFDFCQLGAGFGTINLHIRQMIMTQYLFDQKGFSYNQFMEAEIDENMLFQEILGWHEQASN